MIVAVNGRKLVGLSADAATALIKGPPGTEVVLGMNGAGGLKSRHRTPPPRRPSRGGTRRGPPTDDAHRARHARDDLRAGRGLRDADRARGEARRGRARHVQSWSARRSGATAVEKVLHEGARGIVFDLRANGGGLVEEARLIASLFIAHGTIVSTRGRTQPSETITATGDPTRADDPDGRAGRSQHRLLVGDRHRRAAGSPAARPSSAPTPSARASSRRRSRCPTAARWTSRSASTSRPTGATSAAAASSRARASPPKCRWRTMWSIPRRA